MKLPRPALARACALAFTLLAAGAASAQPSGGPYGPQPQVYEVPADAPHVLYVAPDGRAEAPGNAADAPTTLESAIARAITGDAIILRGGTYRTGGLVFNQGITLQPYRDEKPVLKGTLVADKWEALRDGIWRTSWKSLFPMKPESWWRRHREGMRTPLHKFNNDMVFIDGQPLRSVGWEGELDENSFFVDYDNGHVFIRRDPNGRVVEITAQDNAFTRTIKPVHGRPSDKKGPVVRGLTLSQYAYRAIEIEGYDPEGVSPEGRHGKDVVGTLLEHVAITHCSRVAGYFRGDKMVFRNCLISDTSTEGIFILSSNDVLLERNIIARNNIEGITGYYPAAVKIFNQCYRVTCRDNLVIEQPASNGIWYDVGNVDGVFVNNWIEDALDGFFYEISRDAICAGNVFVNCDKGVRILNAAGARVYHNTFVNTVASFERTERTAVGDHFGWHPATGPDVDERDRHEFANNLVAADASFPKALLRADQVPLLKQRVTKPHFAVLDGNVYVRAPGPARSLIAWSPVAGEANQLELKSPADVTKLHPQFEAHSQLLAIDYGAVLRSPRLKNYDTLRELPAAAKVPEDIRRALGWPEGPRSVGAYSKN
ncbi:MAG TPA: right-handed parallel beta-helix repeat-containing protein [Opitutaceae bacterium]|nr:right-handed parallel beta-helix repeat-containing protein [Opitutaceae bacterium]